MLKILMVCNAGMSTSMLVLRMEKVIEAKGVDAIVQAMPLTDAEKHIQEWDVVMLGPQVRHNLNELQKLAPEKPIEVINMRDYGLMNGEKVLDAALKLAGK